MGIRRISARAAMPFSKPRRFTPPTGLMSEQFGRTSGEQSSAKEDLTWSYAAFLTCIRAGQRRITGSPSDA
jgi:GH15 family glucan-1,4-alpha-glucosidase